MGLITYILNTEKSFFLKQIYKYTSPHEYNYYLRNEKNILNSGIDEVNIFNESFLLNLGNSFCCGSLLIKQGHIFSDENLAIRIEEFEKHISNIFKLNTYLIRVDKSLIDEFLELDELDIEDLLNETNNFMKFKDWLLTQDSWHYKFLKNCNNGI